MKTSKIIVYSSLVLFATSFFYPAYLVSIFDKHTPIMGWQCFVYSLPGITDAFDSGAGFNFELFLSSVFAIFSHICLIFVTVAFLRGSNKKNRLLIVGSLGFLSTMWWLGHEVFIGGFSNLLIGYYIWSLSFAGIIFGTIKQASLYSRTGKRNSTNEPKQDNDTITSAYSRSMAPVKVRS